MKRLLSLCALAGLALAAGATPALAQQAVPRAQVSGGYQVLSFKADVDQTFVKGWYADILANFTHHIGGVFELGGDYKTIDETITVPGGTTTTPVDLNVHQYMGGVRVSARPTPGVTPFGEFLVGSLRRQANWPGSVTPSGETFFQSASGSPRTDFAIQAGGGVNVFPWEQVGVRLEADYMRVFPVGQAIEVIRVATGLVIGF